MSPYNNPLHQQSAHPPQSEYSSLASTGAGGTRSARSTVSNLRLITFGRRDSPEQPASMDLLSRSTQSDIMQNLVESSEPVLARLQVREIVLVIHWPGYSTFRHVNINTVNSKGPITRAKLAAEIAVACLSWYQEAQAEPVKPEKVGKWRLGRANGGVPFDRLALGSISNKCENFWEVNIAII